MKQQMTKKSYKISYFNDWMCSQVGQLHTDGEEATDLLACLCKIYLVAPVGENVDNIKFLQNKYEDT